jgi:hypothetical protein
MLIGERIIIAIIHGRIKDLRKYSSKEKNQLYRGGRGVTPGIGFLIVLP